MSSEVDRVPLAEAARRMGISESALRKRVQRGTQPHEIIDDIVHIAVPRVDSGRTGGHGGTVSSVSPELVQQAIQQTAALYAGDMRAIFDQVGELYRDQLAVKDDLIEELRRRAEIAETELDTLRATQGGNTTAAATDAVDERSAAPGQPTQSWWRFWERS